MFSSGFTLLHYVATSHYVGIFTLCGKLFVLLNPLIRTLPFLQKYLHSDIVVYLGLITRFR